MMSEASSAPWEAFRDHSNGIHIENLLEEDAKGAKSLLKMLDEIDLLYEREAVHCQ